MLAAGTFGCYGIGHLQWKCASLSGLHHSHLCSLHPPPHPNPHCPFLASLSASFSVKINDLCLYLPLLRKKISLRKSVLWFPSGQAPPRGASCANMVARAAEETLWGAALCLEIVINCGPASRALPWGKELSHRLSRPVRFPLSRTWSWRRRSSVQEYDEMTASLTIWTKEEFLADIPCINEKSWSLVSVETLFYLLSPSSLDPALGICSLFPFSLSVSCLRI